MNMNHNSVVHETAKAYRFTSICDSQLGAHTTVGDFSRITTSQMKQYSRIDRFSLLYHSILSDQSYAGAYCMIMHTIIGKFTSIAWGVTIGPGDHDYGRATMHDFLYNDYCDLRPSGSDVPYNRFEKKSVIGNDVWVGANVTMVRGVEIGDGAVVGANSTVTRDVPPYAIVAGSPAKIIRYRFSPEIISEMLSLLWWEFPRSVIAENYQVFAQEDIYSVVEQLKSIKKGLKK